MPDWNYFWAWALRWGIEQQHRGGSVLWSVNLRDKYLDLSAVSQSQRLARKETNMSKIMVTFHHHIHLHAVCLHLSTYSALISYVSLPKCGLNKLHNHYKPSSWESKSISFKDKHFKSMCQEADREGELTGLRISVSAKIQKGDNKFISSKKLPFFLHTSTMTHCTQHTQPPMISLGT